MLNEWYLWKKSPGAVGVLPAAQLKKHAGAFIMTVSGTLEDAIRQAEICEREGYSVAASRTSEDDKKDVPFADGVENEVDRDVAFCRPECLENDNTVADEYKLPDFMSFEDFSSVAASSKRPARKKRGVAGDELDGQLSLEF